MIWTLSAALLTAAIWIGGIWRDVEANTAFREQAQPRLEQQLWEHGRSQTSGGHPAPEPLLRYRSGQAQVLTATTGPHGAAPSQSPNHPQTTDGK